MPLHFQKLLQGDCVCLGRLIQRLLLRLEHEARRKGVSILATFTIWTFPEPPEFLGFDGLDEVFANNLSDVNRSEQRDAMREGNRRTSVVVRGLPCFESTTLRNLSSSH